MQAKKPRPRAAKRQKLGDLDLLIRNMLGRPGNPIFKQIVQEWASQVKQGGDPKKFARRYMKLMSDPGDPRGRKGAALFANFMSCRTWRQVMPIMRPKLGKRVLEVLKTRAAAGFYDAFKCEVIGQIRAYWAKFINERKAAQRAAALAAGR